MVVANDRAGSAERKSVTAAAGALAEHGPTSLVWTGDADELAAVIDDLDGRRLCIAGGDGSVHAAVNAVVAAGAGAEPVALLPAGTGNDTARGLDLPLDPVEAVTVAATGTSRRLPVLDIAGGELGVNNLHVGLGVAAARRGTAWKPRLGRLAYPAGTIAEGLRYDGPEVAVEVDGSVVHEGRALVVMVELGPSAGGGTELAPDVELPDPVLTVVVVGDVGLGDRARLSWLTARGRLLDHPDVARHDGRAVSVEAGSPLTYEVDGEMVDDVTKVEARVRPAAWTVVVPPAT